MAAGQVHFKFINARTYDTVAFDGAFVSVGELKRLIAVRKGLGGEAGSELVLSDPETRDEYRNDQDLVPKNTSVLVKRAPIARAHQHSAGARAVQDQHGAIPGVDITSVIDYTGLDPDTNPQDDLFGGDLYSATPQEPLVPMDEEKALNALINDSASIWQKEVAFSSRGRGRGRRGRSTSGGGRGPTEGSVGIRDSSGRQIPPPTYRCHRCEQAGHYISDCPTNGDPNFDLKRVRVPVGIPMTRLAKSIEGNLLLPSGEVGTLLPNEDAFEREMAMLPSLVKEESILKVNEPVADLLPPSRDTSSHVPFESVEITKQPSTVSVPPLVGGSLSCSVSKRCHDEMKAEAESQALGSDMIDVPLSVTPPPPRPPGPPPSRQSNPSGPAISQITPRPPSQGSAAPYLPSSVPSLDFPPGIVLPKGPRDVLARFFNIPVPLSNDQFEKFQLDARKVHKWVPSMDRSDGKPQGNSKERRQPSNNKEKREHDFEPCLLETDPLQSKDGNHDKGKHTKHEKSHREHESHDHQHERGHEQRNKDREERGHREREPKRDREHRERREHDRGRERELQAAARERDRRAREKELDEQFLASRRSKQSFQHEDSISHRNDDQAAKSDRERARSPSCEFPSSRRSKDLQQNDSRRVVCSPRLEEHEPARPGREKSYARISPSRIRHQMQPADCNDNRRSHRDRDTDRENQRSLQRYHDQRPGAAASDDNISHTVRKAELQDILHQKLRRDEDYRIRNEDTVAHSMRGVKDSERHDHSSRCISPVYEKRKLDRRDADGHQTLQRPEFEDAAYPDTDGALRATGKSISQAKNDSMEDWSEYDRPECPARHGMDNLDTRTTIGRLEGRLVPAAPKKARSESSKGRLNGRLEVVEAGRENESTRKTDKQPRGDEIQEDEQRRKKHKHHKSRKDRRSRRNDDDTGDRKDDDLPARTVRSGSGKPAGDGMSMLAPPSRLNREEPLKRGGKRIIFAPKPSVRKKDEGRVISRSGDRESRRSRDTHKSRRVA